MNDKTSVIFGNPIDDKTIREAEKAKAKYIKKYGDDSEKKYELGACSIPTLDFLGAENLVFEGTKKPDYKNAVIVGNIRMGFGHYRISIAMASCARALGYTPYWLDLAGFDATGSKMIREQNNLYSLASRISQKSRLFNKFVWEPLNSEGFKKLTYNAKDQKTTELLVPILRSVPRDTPYIATHVWPAQAAVHAGFTHVINAVPDNWPMALHLAEGSVHAVQTNFAYLGYKMLNGFAKTPLKGIPAADLKMVGRFIDHELLVNLKEDNEKRRARAREGKPVRFLMTVGGAGAGFEQFLSMVKHLLPYVKTGKAALFINFGDHRDVYEKMKQNLGETVPMREFFNQYEDLKAAVKSLRETDPEGIWAIENDDIFQAVYSTNLLMPEADVLVTKPSELAFYPIPKLFMKHIGGHERYGAIASSEAGDGTFECDTDRSANEMIDRLLSDAELYCHFCDEIDRLHDAGAYNGAYECVKLATSAE